MSDWKHDQGYKEPEECYFCEHFGSMGHGDNRGHCYRGVEVNPITNRKHSDKICSARGTCRYFRRNPTFV